MAIYGHMGAKGGNARHIYLNREFEVLLDAIAAEMSNSRLGPYGVSRSQLINKAIANYIEECRNEPAIKAAIEKTERNLLDERSKKQRKEVILPLRVVEK
jgi:hypothetical protein